MKKYFPILKSKDGELKTLGVLSDVIKNEIAPVIELLPEDHDSVLARLTSFWAFENNEILVDSSITLGLDPDVAEINTLYRGLKAANVNIVPVIEFNSIDEYVELVRDFSTEFQTKICVRIRNAFANPRLFNPLLLDLLGRLKTTSANVILLFDLSFVSSENYQNIANSAMTNVHALTDKNSWAQIIVASGSFPTDLSRFAANTRNLIPRYEWNIWQEIQADAALREIIQYGDYGIKHPIFDPTVQGFQSSSSIKYTTANDYLIFRGIRPSDHPLGNGQYNQKSALIVADALYDGQAFSYADNEIYECSIRADRPGNAGTWVKVGQSRHIAKLHSLL